MAFIGNTVQTQGFTPAIDYFNGNGVTVTFTLSRPIASVAQVIVAVDNVIQNPSSAFGVVGNSITFTSAPLSGTNNIWVEYTSLITTYQGISQDPTVIGDIRATGGYLAEGDFGNSFVDGNLIDYVTGAGRLTVGELDDLVFYHGGTSARSEIMRMSYAGNSYIVGNLGVGATTSPASQLEVKSAAFTDSILTINSTSTNVSQRLNFTANGTLQTQLYDDSTETRLNAFTSKPMTFRTANTERMRITSDGTVLLGTTSTSAFDSGFRAYTTGQVGISRTDGGTPLLLNVTADTNIIDFRRSSTNVGTISVTTSSTSYNTSSDYRLKENVAPMTGALEKVAQLKPVTYTWKATGETSQGFIAHELQAIVPDCVTGEKDAVDEEGNPVHQGIDTSFLVATLTAAIQEQQQIITDLKARIEALEAK